jgi:hypothetical protein
MSWEWVGMQKAVMTRMRHTRFMFFRFITLQIDSQKKRVGRQ